MNRTIPLSVPDELLKEIQQTARLTHQSMQDVFRQPARIAQAALRSGAVPAERQRISAWDALHCGRGLDLEIRPMRGKATKMSL